MGNNVTKAMDRLGMKPRKFTLKSKKRTGPPVYPPHRSGEVHIHDAVPETPVYAQVNKRKEACEDELHYADVQVLQSRSSTSGGRQRPKQGSGHTEYAIIDFKNFKIPKTAPSSEAADILIPPGELQRPIATRRRTKSATSHRAVLV